jgi:hypothetical protein
MSFPQFAQVIVTDRPDQTESAVSVPKGIFQLETGMGLDINDAERNLVLNTTLFRYGLANNLEIRLVTDLRNRYTRIGESDSHTGIGDMQFGLKYQLPGGKTKAAYLGHVVLPTGTREVSMGSAGMHHRIAISQEAADWLAVSCNLGIEYFRADDAHGIYSLSFGFPLTERIGFYLELYGRWTHFEHLEALYDHGFTLLLAPNLQLDFSMGTGISSRSNYFAIGASWYAPFQD